MISPAPTTTEDETHQLYVSLTRNDDILKVKVGLAVAEIKYNGSVYILSKNSEILARVDECGNGILKLKRNLIGDGLLLQSPTNPQLLITNSKIRGKELKELFDFIIGTHCHIPYTTINELENKQYEFSISLKKEIHGSMSPTGIPKAELKKKPKKQKLCETLDVITARHLQQGRTWHLNCGKSHSVITLVRKQNRKHPDKLLLYFQIQKGSTILKNDDFLCNELKEARNKLLNSHTLIEESNKPSLLKLTENITLAHFSQVFPFITGYDAISPQHVAEIFPETGPGVRLRFSLPTTHVNLHTSDDNDTFQDKKMSLSFAFMKTDDDTIMVASKNAVADVKFANKVFQILPNSTILSDEFSVTSLSKAQKRIWLESGAVERHSDDETLLVVKSKLRSTSLEYVFEIITGHDCHLHFSNIGEMPEMFEFDPLSE